MKRIYLILTVVVFGFVYFSCSNSDERIESEKSVDVASLDAGKVHNDMLFKYEQRKAKSSNYLAKTKAEEFDDMVSGILR